MPLRSPTGFNLPTVRYAVGAPHQLVSLLGELVQPSDSSLDLVLGRGGASTSHSHPQVTFLVQIYLEWPRPHPVLTSAHNHVSPPFPPVRNLVIPPPLSPPPRKNKIIKSKKADIPRSPRLPRTGNLPFSPLAPVSCILS
jgi:hypothetical protein